MTNSFLLFTIISLQIVDIISIQTGIFDKESDTVVISSENNDFLETKDKSFIALRRFNDKQQITETIGDGAIAANQFCMEIFGTNLATITSQTDQNEFNNLCNALNELDDDQSTSPSCWIGGFFDSTISDYIYFKTLTSMSYNNWINDDEKNQKHCILSKHGVWESTECDKASDFYICDHPERTFSECKDDCNAFKVTLTDIYPYPYFDECNDDINDYKNIYCYKYDIDHGNPFCDNMNPITSISLSTCTMDQHSFHKHDLQQNFVYDTIPKDIKYDMITIDDEEERYGITININSNQIDQSFTLCLKHFNTNIRVSDYVKIETKQDDDICSNKESLCTDYNDYHGLPCLIEDFDTFKMKISSNPFQDALKPHADYKGVVTTYGFDNYSRYFIIIVCIAITLNLILLLKCLKAALCDKVTHQPNNQNTQNRSTTVDSNSNDNEN